MKYDAMNAFFLPRSIRVLSFLLPWHTANISFHRRKLLLVYSVHYRIQNKSSVDGNGVGRRDVMELKTKDSVDRIIDFHQELLCRKERKRGSSHMISITFIFLLSDPFLYEDLLQRSHTFLLNSHYISMNFFLKRNLKGSE